MKVLFVDDETDTLEQGKIFLEEEDDRLSIETAVSAEDGLELLDGGRYDAIVSDYQMPEMNGLDFLKTVREDMQKDIPFIMFTGKGREEVAMDALNLGADRYLQKRGSPKAQFSFLAQAIIQEVKHYKAQEKLRKNERRLSFAMETAKAGVWEGEIENDEVFWHESCERLYGLEPGTFEGTPEGFYKRVHEEDLPNVKKRAQKSRGGRLILPPGVQD